MFVIYTGANEIIVTNLASEHQMLKDYFAPEMGRDLEEYDREVEERGPAVTFKSEIAREW